MASKVKTWAERREAAVADGVVGEHALEALRRCSAPERHQARVEATIEAARAAGGDDAPALLALDASASGTRRAPWARGLGKGRRAATDGAAWVAAGQAASESLPVKLTHSVVADVGRRYPAARGDATKYARARLEDHVRQYYAHQAYADREQISEWDACVSGLVAAQDRLRSFLVPVWSLVQEAPATLPGDLDLPALDAWRISLVLDAFAEGGATFPLPPDELPGALSWLALLSGAVNLDGEIELAVIWRRSRSEWLNRAISWRAPTMLWADWREPIDDSKLDILADHDAIALASDPDPRGDVLCARASCVRAWWRVVGSGGEGA